MHDQWLYTHFSVHADPATAARLLLERGHELLRAGIDADRVADGRLSLTVGTGSERATLELALGDWQQHGSMLRLPVRWSPSMAHGFSNFEGEVAFETVSDDAAELEVFGRYHIPQAQRAGAIIAETRALARRLLRGLGREVAALAPVEGISEPGAARLLVRHLMSPDPVTVAEDTPITTAALVLLHHRVGGVPVVDDTGGPVGVLSETDLLAREASPRDREGALARQEALRRTARTAGEACSRPPLVISPDATVREAARMLLDADVARLLVVDDQRLVGVLSRHDVLRALARSPAQLQAHVDSRLDEEGIHGVAAHVTGPGTIHLSGAVRDARAAAEVERVVATVDGVVDVVNELRMDDAVAFS